MEPEMANGYAIELENDFEWNEDSVLQFTTHDCFVVLLGKSEEEQSYILLEFHNALTARTASTDCSPDIGIHSEVPGKSSISVLTNSDWDNEAHKKYTYSGTPKRRSRKHYVVSNHDLFHEILAESFSERKVALGDPGFEQIEAIFQCSRLSTV